MKSFQQVEAFINETIEQKLIPGAVLAVATNDAIIYKKAFGKAFPSQQIDMTTDTVFDAASLTKVMATLPAVLVCLERGWLDLDDSVSFYLPAFEALHHDVTLKHLLTHTSGWQPFIQFYKLGVSYAEAIELIAATPKQQPLSRAVVYSDLNFIVLGEIVQRVTNESLADFTRKEVYERAGMYQTTYNPPTAWQPFIAPTEQRADGSFTWGEVHDENAHHFGGVSGHAGLFTTVEDTVRYGQLYLNGGGRVLQRATVNMVTNNYTSGLNDARAIGWECYYEGKYSGQYVKDGFGHTGFTGTSLWISPQHNLVIALLTNRVHYGRDKNISRFRRIVHNLVTLACEK